MTAPVQPTEPVDVQAFVDTLPSPFMADSPLHIRQWEAIRAFAAQAINAWIAAHPPVQPMEPS